MEHDYGTEVVPSNRSDGTTKVRRFALTVFDDSKLVFDNSMKYLIIGNEICPETGRHHKQCYVEFNNPRMPKAVHKKYVAKGWVRPAYSTAENNIKYCKKDGDYQEFGEMPVGQGHRTDIVEMYNDIKKNNLDEKKVIDKYTMLYLKYGNGIRRMVALNEEERRWKTKVILIVGPTGTGKSRFAFCKRWQASSIDYKGAFYIINGRNPNVAFDEFEKSDIPHGEFLKLTDRYPHVMNIKGGSTNNWIRTLILTCNDLPHWWDEACQRRITFYIRH